MTLTIEEEKTCMCFRSKAVRSDRRRLAQEQVVRAAKTSQPIILPASQRAHTDFWSLRQMGNPVYERIRPIARIPKEEQTLRPRSCRRLGWKGVRRILGT